MSLFAFERAAKNADPSCPKCKGTGRYQYSATGTPHFTICDRCCKHGGSPRWRLSSPYSGYPGMCCGDGCGHVQRTPLEAAHRWLLDRASNVGLWPWFGWQHAVWSVRNRWRYPYPGSLLSKLRRRVGSAGLK